ncbi:serine hydrolase domain-containing protein [Winogradskyella wichelsiae]|uniref:serine hydrolase domain-containing protein n=1 Tax=Winogradskyella wichelsiae TaxID=2697007 RepID=UPI0015CB8F97|nr:serine hydrolase [Winogradskyella wichelsiae]
MKPTYLIALISFFAFTFSCSTDDVSLSETSESLYFPPINSDVWETTSSAELDWDDSQLEPLLTFLEEKNSKAFIILHEGKIVEEHYFGDHTDSTPWYWASAGKTLTAAIAGIAQEEGLIDINEKVSDYLGTGWTTASLEKENLITSRNLLEMTSGLNDNLGDDVSTSHLHYLEDAGERWAYHNVYLKLQDVVSAASHDSWSNYFNTKLKAKIGMSGAWLQTDNSNVYWSTARSMARFGLLSLANGKWETDQIVPELFMYDATNTSQLINEAYGYSWWLNGKSTYHLPKTQFEFQDEIIPNAPSDTFAALGKNDQKIYVVPSKDLVIIRMGEAADDENFALSSFDTDLWEKINAFIN